MQERRCGVVKTVGGRSAGVGGGRVREMRRRSLGAGALFWYDLLGETGLDPAVALPALWDLVWTGEITNDAWQPLRASRRFETPRAEKRLRRFSRQRANAITATQGRWSTTAGLFAGNPDARVLSELLLERQGTLYLDTTWISAWRSWKAVILARPTRRMRRSFVWFQCF